MKAAARTALALALIGTGALVDRESPAAPRMVDAPGVAVPGGAPAMQRYWLGFLTRGPGWTPQRTAHSDSVQAAHLANIGRSFEAGALVCAGPFLDNTSLRGIFIFRGDSAVAAAFAAGDQAIQERRLALELRPWLGPAGISDAYRAARAGNPKLRDSMATYQFGLLKRGAAGTPPTRDSLAAFQRGHFMHLMGLMQAGSLLVAGPFTDGRDPEGVLIFRTDSAQAVRAMADDPLVQRGWLTVELHLWMTADGILPVRPPAAGK